MDDITAPRIEPLGDKTDLDQYPPKRKAPRERETPEKRPPSPSIESDDITEEIHEIDELA
jgi:hypothetical protein